MAAPMALNLLGLASDVSDLCTIEATVVTGFESLAKEECLEKLHAKAVVARGRIIFDIPIALVSEVLKLKSVDNVFVLMIDIGHFDFPKEKEEALLKISAFANEFDWEKGLLVWKTITGYTGDLRPQGLPATASDGGTSCGKVESDAVNNAKHAHDIAREISSNSDTDANADAIKNTKPNEDSPIIIECINNSVKSGCELNVDNVGNECVGDQANTNDKLKNFDGNQLGVKRVGPSFRVTCNRTGSSHSFGSPDAAAYFGSGIIDRFGWHADMTGFDIEVVLNICDQHAYAGLALTKESLHRRNIHHFGPTTLRATIAYSMLRLGNIRPGEIVCDPMCGGGSIPIEAAMSWPQSYHICGDLHELAWCRAKNNLDDFNKRLASKHNSGELKIDILKWDTTILPLRANFVDVFVTDMPFGKRSGKKIDNRILYSDALFEMARVAKVSTGRAVLLTQDRRSMMKAMQNVVNFWRNVRTLNINIGGLAAAVYLLHRTSFKAKTW